MSRVCQNVLIWRLTRRKTWLGYLTWPLTWKEKTTWLDDWSEEKWITWPALTPPGQEFPSGSSSSWLLECIPQSALHHNHTSCLPHPPYLTLPSLTLPRLTSLKPASSHFARLTLLSLCLSSPCLASPPFPSLFFSLSQSYITPHTDSLCLTLSLPQSLFPSTLSLSVSLAIYSSLSLSDTHKARLKCISWSYLHLTTTQYQHNSKYIQPDHTPSPPSRVITHDTVISVKLNCRNVFTSNDDLPRMVANFPNQTSHSIQ